VPGVFACGDVRLSPVKRAASTFGEGSTAIAFAPKYLQQDARRHQLTPRTPILQRNTSTFQSTKID